MTIRQLNEEAIFHVAREITNPVARSEYIAQMCNGNDKLRERVEELLRIHEGDEEFLKSAAQPSPTVDYRGSEEAGHEVGRYKLREKLGEGGFGVVWAAEQQQPVRRKVALKIIKPGMDSRDVVARFEAERQALALMDHPNIARVLDGGTTREGRPYFVMELIRGVPITEYCDENRLTVAERLRLFVDVCKAVQHAHQKGIIHRDIKPSNVLVTLHDNAPVPKVIDFGVAKALSQQLTDKTIYTRVHAAVGTLAYMAPEQAALSGQDIDTRADIYGLGVLLYELLTGTTPLDPKRLERAAFDEAIRIIRDEEPPKASTRLSSLGATATAVSAKRQTDPSGLQKLVRGELDWILLKALEKDRTRRYETASALATDIQRLLNHEPVEACPPSALYRARKFVGRNRTLVIGAITSSALLIAGLIGTTTGWIEAANAKRKLQAQNEKQAELIADFQAELFEKALAAAMSASPNTQQLIAKARDAGVEDWRLEILEGQRLIFAGEPERAVDRLKRAVQLVNTRAKQSVAAEAMLAKAHFYAGHLLEGMVQMNKADSLQPSDQLDYLFLAWSQLASPDRGLRLLSQSEKEGNAPTAVSLAIRSEIKAFHGFFSGRFESVADALEDVSAARLLLGETKLTLQTELTALIAAITLSRERGLDPQQYDRRAKEVADRLLKYSDYAVGRMVRSWYFLAIEDDAAAAAELREICHLSENPYLHASLAFLLFQSGDSNKSREAIDIVSRFRSSTYQDACSLILADHLTGLENKDIGGHTFGKQEHADGSFYSLYGLMGRQMPDEARSRARAMLESRSLSTPATGTWAQLEVEALKYIARESTEAQLVAVANGNREWSCEAHLVIGLRHIADGDFDAARERLKTAIQYDLFLLWPYQQSLGLLRRLDDPRWLEERAKTSDRN
jgi:serine/threonine protein kinase